MVDYHIKIEFSNTRRLPDSFYDYKQNYVTSFKRIFAEYGSAILATSVYLGTVTSNVEKLSVAYQAGKEFDLRSIPLNLLRNSHELVACFANQVMKYLRFNPNQAKFFDDYDPGLCFPQSYLIQGLSRPQMRQILYWLTDYDKYMSQFRSDWKCIRPKAKLYFESMGYNLDDYVPDCSVYYHHFDSSKPSRYQQHLKYLSWRRGLNNIGKMMKVNEYAVPDDEYLPARITQIRGLFDEEILEPVRPLYSDGKTFKFFDTSIFSNDEPYDAMLYRIMYIYVKARSHNYSLYSRFPIRTIKSTSIKKCESELQEEQESSHIQALFSDLDHIESSLHQGEVHSSEAQPDSVSNSEQSSGTSLKGTKAKFASEQSESGFDFQKMREIDVSYSDLRDYCPDAVSYRKMRIKIESSFLSQFKTVYQPYTIIPYTKHSTSLKKGRAGLPAKQYSEDQNIRKSVVRKIERYLDHFTEKQIEVNICTSVSQTATKKPTKTMLAQLNSLREFCSESELEDSRQSHKLCSELIQTAAYRQSQNMKYQARVAAKQERSKRRKTQSNPVSNAEQSSSTSCKEIRSSLAPGQESTPKLSSSIQSKNLLSFLRSIQSESTIMLETVYRVVMPYLFDRMKDQSLVDPKNLKRTRERITVLSRNLSQFDENVIQTSIDKAALCCLTDTRSLDIMDVVIVKSRLDQFIFRCSDVLLNKIIYDVSITDTVQVIDGTLGATDRWACASDYKPKNVP